MSVLCSVAVQTHKRLMPCGSLLRAYIGNLNTASQKKWGKVTAMHETVSKVDKNADLCVKIIVTVSLSGGSPSPHSCSSLCLASTTWSLWRSASPSQKITKYFLTWPSDPFRCTSLSIRIYVAACSCLFPLSLNVTILKRSSSYSLCRSHTFAVALCPPEEADAQFEGHCFDEQCL